MRDNLHVKMSARQYDDFVAKAVNPWDDLLIRRLVEESHHTTTRGSSPRYRDGDGRGSRKAQPCGSVPRSGADRLGLLRGHGRFGTELASKNPASRGGCESTARTCMP